MAIAKIIYKESASASGVTWMDVTQKTVTNSTMLNGITALDNTGSSISGNIATRTAQTWYPMTNAQTISSGFYSTEQGIRAVIVSNLAPSYIMSGITVNIGDTDNPSRITSVVGTFQGGESFALIYKSLALKNAIVSTASMVSEWMDSLSSMKAYMFAGQPFQGDFVFPRITKLAGYAFAKPYANQGVVAGSCTLTFPSVSSIGNVGAVFYYNDPVSRVSFPILQDIPPYTFTCARLPLVASTDFPECKTIGSSAFQSMMYLSSVEFPKVSVIEVSVFMRCTALKTAIFPSCTQIGNGAFSGCNSLETISFPECETIGQAAFLSCSDLTSASFSKCTSVGGSAFAYCSKIGYAYLPVCSVISTNAFAYAASLSSVIAPNCQQLGMSAFGWCSVLSVVAFPSCTSVSTGTFSSCSCLTTASFPACKSISPYMFNGCALLSSINFLTCTYIGSSAFRSCSSLQTVSFPACTQIDAYAFGNCFALESVYLMGSSVISAQTNIFSRTPIAASSYLGHFGSIYVPSSLVNTYKTATNWAVHSARFVGV